jgi:hypothetical protein
VREHWKSDAPSGTAHGCVVVTGDLGAAASARVAGLVDNLEGAGTSVEVVKVGPGAVQVPAAARDARLVLLVGVGANPAVDELIAERASAGLPTALDVCPDDIALDDIDALARLTPAAAKLAAACGLVVAPGGARYAAAVASGGRALLLPTLLARPRAAALRDTRIPGDPPTTRVIGWRLGAGTDSAPHYADAVAAGIERYLTEHRDCVEIVGDAARVPAALRSHERVAVVGGRDVDPETIAGWDAHVWTPNMAGDEVVDDARVLEEASCAGVPSIMPAGACGGVDGLISSHVLVQTPDDPDLWYDALHHVLDDPNVHARRAEEVARRADAVDGAAASKAVVSRLMGWASYKSGARS